MERSANLEEIKRCAVEDIKRYQQMVGKFIYLNISRPDIAYVANIVSKFMHAPKHAHMVIVKSIYPYVKGKKFFGLMYTNNKANLQEIKHQEKAQVQ